MAGTAISSTGENDGRTAETILTEGLAEYRGGGSAGDPGSGGSAGDLGGGTLAPR